MGIPRIGLLPHAGAAYRRSAVQPVALTTAATIAAVQLQQARAQVEELQQALASSQQESMAARQQVTLLTEANGQLRELVAQGEKEVTKARHFAYHDKLTGLPNRTLLLDRLNQALVRAKRQDSQLALLLLDLDGFKDINDRMGHAAGDTLLRRVADRLLACIRGGDTACRYGGDEFVLLLPEVDGRKRALEVAEKIRFRLAKPYMVDDYSIAVTASIGVAVYPVDGMGDDDLIKQADVAMYLAKTVKNSSKARTEIASFR